MKDLIIEILKVVAPASVMLIVFAQGLGIAPSLVAAYFKEKPRRILQSLIATLILVPAVTLALILLLDPLPGIAIGLAILVACPPAPLMLKDAVKKGGGNAAFMASLHLLLAGLAFITVPAILYLLSIPLHFHADVDLGVMALLLGKTILIPLSLGLLVRAFIPSFADRAGQALGKIGTIGSVIVVLFGLMALYPTLLNMDAGSYLVIAAVSASALAIGHLLGPIDPSEKTVLAVECGVRHPVLALTIGIANFGREDALLVLFPCIVTFIGLATIYMIWRGKSLRSKA